MGLILREFRKSLFFKDTGIRIRLARVNVNNQNYIVPYLIIDGEAFYKQYPYTRKVRKTTNLWEGRGEVFCFDFFLFFF